MTRQEALGLIKSDGIYSQEVMDALEQEPCDDSNANQHNSNALNALEGDLISREELLKAIDTWDKFGYTETGCFVREPKGDYIPYIHYDDVIKCIKGMPSVNPQESKIGEWQQDLDGTYLCSECGSGFKEQPTLMGKPMFLWCPLCGAKIVEPQESEG